MSVLVADRTLSRYEAVAYASILHSQMREFMQRNFGIKDLLQLCQSNYAHGLDEVESFQRYQYMLTTHKNNIDLVRSLLRNNVRAAQNLYPTNMHELEVRRDYQNDALANCQALLGELMQIVEDFHVIDSRIVDINGFKPYNDAINREIDLIKGWRQRDNRFKSYFSKPGNI